MLLPSDALEAWVLVPPSTGMLAVPVLAGSAAYGVSELFSWREGLDDKLREAKAFYATIAIATLGVWR